MKKTTTKTKLTEEEIKEMEDISEENELRPAPKYTLPSVRIHGTEGYFRRTIIENGELKIGDDDRAVLENMGNSVNGVILKVRKTLFFDSESEQLFSNESGIGKNAKFTIFQKKETKKGFSILPAGTGTAEEMKAMFPEIRMMQIVYFLLTDTNEVARLKVKGLGLGQFFDYRKEFSNSEHFFEYITQLGAKTTKTSKGSFYMNTFTRGKKIDNLSLIQSSLREVNQKLNDIEEYHAEKEAEALANQECKVELPKAIKPMSADDIAKNEEEDIEIIEETTEEIDGFPIVREKVKHSGKDDGEPLSEEDKKQRDESFGK